MPGLSATGPTPSPAELVEVAGQRLGRGVGDAEDGFGGAVAVQEVAVGIACGLGLSGGRCDPVRDEAGVRLQAVESGGAGGGSGVDRLLGSRDVAERVVQVREVLAGRGVDEEALDGGARLSVRAPLAVVADAAVAVDGGGRGGGCLGRGRRGGHQQAAGEDAGSGPGGVTVFQTSSFGCGYRLGHQLGNLPNK